MGKQELREKIKELTLMLLYLTSWEENEFGMQYHKSWKRYDFGILDELSEADLIRGGRRSKSVMITDEGIKKAKDLLKQFCIDKE